MMAALQSECKDSALFHGRGQMLNSLLQFFLVQAALKCLKFQQRVQHPGQAQLITGRQSRCNLVAWVEYDCTSPKLDMQWL